MAVIGIPLSVKAVSATKITPDTVKPANALKADTHGNISNGKTTFLTNCGCSNTNVEALLTHSAKKLKTTKPV